MQLETLDASVRDYIREIEVSYEQQYQQLQTRNKELESAIVELKNNYEIQLKEHQFKYLEIKEQYDLLVYKRFARSAEQILADEKQPPLFTEGAEEAETAHPVKPEELSPVKSFMRKNTGRKPLSPNLE
jgi:transposase